MPLLTDEDHEKLRGRGVPFQEDEAARCLVFLSVPLPNGMYQVSSADVLVIIPPNYPDAGNDMLWTYPRLVRADGALIPNTSEPGPHGDNRTFEGREFCRWSRHWQDHRVGRWRPGIDDVISIYRRIEWALNNPNASNS